MSSVTASGTSAVNHRRVFVATGFGHLVEWYEFSVYGFVAVHIGATFFPSGDPTTQLLATFGIFAFTFLFRPLGALIFGPMADRVGRRPVLVIVILLMSGSTFLIGLLPGYTTIGVLAPLLLLLLRALQSVSAGGEFGGVTAFMLEYSQPGRRGRTTSWLMSFAVIGFLVGSLIVTLLAAVLSDSAMASWGWRIPFLLAGPLGLIGLYIRLRLEDTPVFRELEELGEISRTPLRDALRYPRELWTTIALGGLHTAFFYTVLTFMVSLIAQTAKFGSTVGLMATVAGGVAALLPIPFMAALSDRIGRRPVLIASSAAILVGVVPIFWLILSSPTGAVIGQVLLGLLLGSLISTTLVSMTEIFPAQVRAAGSSLAYTIASTAIGGTVPFVATWLVRATGDRTSPAWYLVGIAALGLIAALTFKQPREDDLEQRHRDQTNSGLRSPSTTASTTEATS
ncbi:MFS transporter [Kribbia dieselivorans]|uniref:MFS transporter n=1 Tax=Kribbia dieselivorans TaxID=331526 RepID=UPI0009F84655|nr:MFS transporter [Kribbia dieselivorans]